VHSDALRDFWHPVGWSASVGPEPYQTVLLDTTIVVWRDAKGAPHDVAIAYRGALADLGVEDSYDAHPLDETPPGAPTGRTQP